MGSAPLPKWASEPCIMGIDEAGRGPVLGPMVYGCLYCARSYQKTLASLNFADSKTLKEEKREELFENLKAESSLGWEVDIIDPRELSAKMLKREKINLNEISHNSAIGLVRRVLNMGVLLTEVYVDTVGDAEKYRIKLSERFPGVKFVVAKKADSLYPVVSGASIVAKVTRDRALRGWILDETAENMHRNFGSGYPGDPETKTWLDHHKHPMFGFPTLVRFSWGTCTPYFKDVVEVIWESDKLEDDGSNNNGGKRQLKLSNVGFTGYKKKSEDIESSGEGRLSVMKLVQKVKVLESLKPLCHRWLLGSSDELPLNAIPIGCLPVYVGEERQRFVIPTEFLSHPLFRMLLERAYREYGFEQRSGLMFPCNVSVFQEVVSALKYSHGQFDLEKLMEELI